MSGTIKQIYLAQDRHLQWVGHFKLSDDTISPTPLSVPPGARSQSKSTQDNWVAPFQNLDVPYTRVGNMCVHPRRTVPPRACTGAPRDRLVPTSAQDHFVQCVTCLVIPPSGNSNPVVVLAPGAKCKVATE